MSPEFRRPLAYLLPYRRALAVILLLSALNTTLALAQPYLSKVLVDRAFAERDLVALYWTVALFAVAAIGGFFLTAVIGLRYTRVSANVLFDMRLAVYQHLLKLSPRFYARRPLGDILARINNDVGEIQRVASESLFSWVGNLLFFVGSVVAMLWLDARLAVAGLTLLPISVWVLVRTRRSLARHIKAMREASAAIGSFLVETLQIVRLVVTSNAQTRESQRFHRANAGFIKALMAMQLWSYFSGAAPGLVLSAGYAVVFLYGGRRVIDGSLTLGTFIAFMAYYMRIFSPIQALMGLYSSLATVQVSLTRVHELLDAAPDVVEAAAAVRLPKIRGTIEFDGVSLDFGRGQVLQAVTFSVAAGQTLAIVGPSGSGKSTIADLLVRLLDPDAGVVRLDGFDLTRVSLEDVRRRIALVDQAPMLLHATIAENVRYARPDASELEVQGAIHLAGLDELLDRLPDRLNTIVGERGAALSAGERQRIAIARALLMDPDVLVLDEPTAALDPVSERQVLDGYRRAMHGRTTVLITHDFALASEADRVVVLGERGIIEQGQPAELLAKGGRFATLFEDRIHVPR